MELNRSKYFKKKGGEFMQNEDLKGIKKSYLLFQIANFIFLIAMCGITLIGVVKNSLFIVGVPITYLLMRVQFDESRKAKKEITRLEKYLKNIHDLKRKSKELDQKLSKKI